LALVIIDQSKQEQKHTLRKNNKFVLQSKLSQKRQQRSGNVLECFFCFFVFLQILIKLLIRVKNTLIKVVYSTITLLYEKSTFKSDDLMLQIKTFLNAIESYKDFCKSLSK